MEEVPNISDFQREERVKQAVLVIGEIKQRVAVMGANDFEIPALDTLLEALNEGECTPEEAIAQAHLIMDRKADYH